MIRPLRPVRPPVPLLALAPLLLAGCATRYESASLSGGAMMRIDVEVYKGPLSIPVSGQIGQMGAVVTESIRAAAQWHEAGVGLAESEYQASKLERSNLESQLDDISNKIVGSIKDSTISDPDKHRIGTEISEELLFLYSAYWNNRRPLIEGKPASASPSAADTVEISTDIANRAVTNVAEKYAKLKDNLASKLSNANIRAALVGAATLSSIRLPAEYLLRNFENKMCSTITKNNDTVPEGNHFVDIYADDQDLKQSTKARDCAALQDSITIARQIILSGCNLIAQPDFIDLLGRATYVPLSTCSFYGYTTSYPNRTTIEERYRSRFSLASPKLAAASKVNAEDEDTEKANEKLFDEKSIVNRLKNDAGVITIAVDNYAALLRSAGFRTAFSNVRYVPRNRTVRSAIIGFGFVNAEYGNQIQGRIAVLTKQISDPPTEARLLPTADYLRDSSNTRFLQLAEWLDGAGDRDRRRSPGRLDVEDRVRLAQSLTNDYYWQNVSAVYGSGRGKTGMAFIKDDIGNWDLKSFTSDPTELLAAYRDVTSAALKSAVKLATSAAAPGAKALGAAGEKLSVARSLRDLATQVASPESGDGGSAEQTARLRTRLVNDLNDLKKQFADAPAKRKKDADDKEILLNDNKNTEANEKSALEKRQGELTVAKKAYDDCDKNTDCSALNTAYLKAVTDKAAAEKSLATAEQARIEAEKANDAAKLALANIEKDARAALAAQLDRQADIIAALELLAVPPEPAKPAAAAAATTGTTPP